MSQHVVAVIQPLAEHSLPFQGSNETSGTLQNGNFLGLLELVAHFDPFLADHISKCWHHTSPRQYVMNDQVHSAIVDEISFAAYFILYVSPQ